MGYRSAKVFVRNTYAGNLSETEDGYVFAYDNDYIESSDSTPVSLTMPIRKEPYVSNTLFPFFDGLIPEGWLLTVVTNNWKIQHNDRFGVLLVACRDCIGNVSIVGGSV